MNRARQGAAIAIPILLAAPILSIAYKTYALGYALADVLPRTLYRVTWILELDGHARDARVRTLLPLTDSRQSISDEVNDSQGFTFTAVQEGMNRVATWSGAGVRDGARIRYSLSVLSRAVRFELDPTIGVPTTYPKSVTSYLLPEEAIQVDAPAIGATLAKIRANEGSIADRLRRIYELTSAMRQRPFKGMTDALTALELGEASCNGKSRLFVALARASGIPARLVGGLVMTAGSRRTSHQWVEAYVEGHWVPFCPTNHHFAELPEHYLALYYGDQPLFKKTRDINFRYRFEVATTPVPSDRAKQSFRFFNVWAMFERQGLPFSLLRTVLLLPIAALVVVLFRNVIGMPTFGTFLPALLAASSAETGAIWGVAGVLIIVFAVALVRLAVQRLQILHSPTLSILLTGVTLTMLATSLLADQLGLAHLTRISLFPIAVLAITAERFYLSLTEKGIRTACRELGGTLVVMLACHVVMASLALQILVTGFPEVLLAVIAANLYLGRWVGLRLSEYVRFSPLLAARRIP